MAQSKPSVHYEDKVLECPICLAELVKPKQLPCLHNFCLKCLKDHCSSSKSKYGNKACPVCRQAFDIPQGGVDLLRNNEFIERLVLEKELREGKKEPKCELCQEIGEDMEAQAFCIECSQRLCKRCHLLHSKQTVSRLHRIVDIKEMLNDKELQRLKPQYCSEHSGKEIELYCCDCEKLLCYSCHATEHNKHICKVTKDISKVKKESFMQELSNLKKQSQNGVIKSKDLAVLKEKLQGEVSQTKKSIEKSFSELIQQILAYKSKLLEEVEEKEKIKMKEIDSAIDLDELHNTEFSGFVAYSGVLMERGTDCEIIRVADELSRRAKELNKRNIEQNETELPDISVKYVIPSKLTEETLQKYCGRIDLTEQKGDITKSNDSDAKQTLLDPKDPLYTALEKMILSTWHKDLVGKENDAYDLQHQKVVVDKIYMVENVSIFKKYDSYKKHVEDPRGGKLPDVQSLPDKKEIETMANVGDSFKKNLNKDVNECYLLYGTTPEKLGCIIKTGLDSRLYRESLFGQGIYFAESSTKADQYADDRTNRKGVRESLFMFVVRVTLGRIHVCQRPQQFRRAPCSDHKCASDTCTRHLPYCDSVIGTHAYSDFYSLFQRDTRKLLFREFVVYKAEQCYPEFIVKYHRE